MSASFFTRSKMYTHEQKGFAQVRPMGPNVGSKHCCIRIAGLLVRAQLEEREELNASSLDLIAIFTQSRYFTMYRELSGTTKGESRDLSGVTDVIWAV